MWGSRAMCPTSVGDRTSTIICCVSYSSILHCMLVDGTDQRENYIVHLIDLTSEVAPDNLRQAPYSNVPQVSSCVFRLYEFLRAPADYYSSLTTLISGISWHCIPLDKQLKVERVKSHRRGWSIMIWPDRGQIIFILSSPLIGSLIR